ELQAKDTTIKKLKTNIKQVNETSTSEDFDEIETINIKPKHKQLNQKSVEVTDLNAQLQEKVFVITTLKDDLRKLKRKDIVDNAAQISNAATIAPGMYKLDPVILALKVKNNMEAYEYYLKHTMEQAAILREVVKITLWYLDSSCSKHMIRDRSQLTNFVNKFLGTVKFGNDQVAKIMGTNMYSLSIGDMIASFPICLLSKATKTKSWLWHRRLSHLNFGALNHLARNGLVRGLPILKFEKDHLCSACAMGKSKKKSYKSKSEDINQEKLYLLYMDLCGPMRVASVNRK
nr:integrase, catalytic region, zinc finger, CCHC-type, peptidase aspartic, catalytic [Tanacetum cinerariifolium]